VEAGGLDGRQQAIYDVVRGAELAGVAKAGNGVVGHEVHRTAATVIADGLIQIGLMKGSAEDAAESGAVSMFFPHGVGHMVGLGVRDVGGAAPGRDEGRICCGARVRVDLPLEPRFLMTVEPGVYFVDALLDNAERRTEFADFLNWQKIDAFRGIGGVRIEDNVLVQPEGPPRNLTAAIPK